MGPVENAIRVFFMLEILQEKAEKIPKDFHQLLPQGVKQGGLNL